MKTLDAHVVPAEPPQEHGSVRRRHGDALLAASLLVLALLAVTIAVLGPLGLDVVRYHASDDAINQVAGGDIAALGLMVPWTLAAAWLVARGHRAGPALALGPGAYGVYMYAQLALGNDITRYEGTSERFFLLFVVAFLAAGVVLGRGWWLTGRSALPEIAPRVATTVAWYLLVVAAFLVLGLHLPGLIDAWLDEPTSAEYLADPTVFWLVKFMDLAIVVPILAVTGWGLLGARVWAPRLGYAVTSWAALLGSSVAGMAWFMQINGDPGASVVNTAVFTVFALFAIAMCLVLYLPAIAGGASGD